MTTRQLRALRGTAAAWVAAILASTAHTLAGGGAPPPLLTAAVALLAAPIAVALAGRRLALWRVALTVLASQALFHVAFALAGHVGPSEQALGHTHGVVALSPIATAPTLVVDPRMIAGHVVAALVTVAVLHRGERMLRALGRGILRLFRPVLGAPAPRRRIVLVATTGRIAVAASVLFSDLSRRGPPVVAAAR